MGFFEHIKRFVINVSTQRSRMTTCTCTCMYSLQFPLYTCAWNDGTKEVNGWSSKGPKRHYTCI